MVSKLSLGIVDYIVIGFSLLISSGIGVFFRMVGYKQKSTNEFLLAGKDMPKLPVVLSSVVTMCSGVTLLSTPGEVYRFGFTTIYATFATFFGVMLAAYVFIPVYFNCGVTSIYEFLEVRYGKKMRYAISGMFLLQMTLYMGISLYVPVLALSVVTSMSPAVLIVICGLVCTFYCTLGGLKAVMWTDAIQAVFVLIFIILTIVQGTVEAGGPGEVFRISSEGERLDILKFSPDMTQRYTFWSATVRGICAGLAYYGTSQIEVQRVLSMRSLERAKSCMLWCIGPCIFLYSACKVIGLAMYAIYHSCDPIKDGLNTGLIKYDQMVPNYIVTRFISYPGVTGLCVAGVFSGALSTLSSAINSMSTVTVVDFIKPALSISIPDKRTVLYAKLLTLFYGLVSIGLAIALSKTDSIQASSHVLMGVVEGPILAVFLIGVFSRKGSEKSAIVGMIFGIVFSSWIGYGFLFSGSRSASLPVYTSGCLSSMNSTLLCANTTSSCYSKFKPTSSKLPFIMYRLSFLWVSPLGCVSAILVTVIITLITGRKDVIPANSRCLSPLYKFWKRKELLEKDDQEPNKISLDMK